MLYSINSFDGQDRILLYCAMASGRGDHHEGPEAARRFEDALKRVLKVSKRELTKREAAYHKSRRSAPSRRSR